MVLLRRNELLAVALILAVLGVRAGIPDGYMPAMPGSGLLVELCPSAVPSNVMKVLRERRPGGHEHAHHGHSGHDPVAAGSADHSMHDSDSCPLAHLLLSSCAVDTTSADPEVPPQASRIAPVPPVITRRAIRTANSSRGPPA